MKEAIRDGPMRDFKAEVGARNDPESVVLRQEMVIDTLVLALARLDIGRAADPIENNVP